MSRTVRRCPHNFCYWGHSNANKMRDRKPWGKPPKWFKQTCRQIERAQVKNVLRHGDFENIPRFRSSDEWDWT